MKFLRRFLDKIKPNFQKGGKLEKFHSTFDAFETFLFTPDTTTKTGCHIRDKSDLKRTMSIVVLALIPSLIFGMWNVGQQHYASIGEYKHFIDDLIYGFFKVFPIIVVTYVVGLSIEFTVAQMRGHEVNEGFLVTGMLIPLTMPPDIPLWMVAIATAFAVIFGKEAFGGTGMNVFNPALLARAFIFFAYPAHISGDIVWTSGLDFAIKNQIVADGFTGATPLALCAAGHTNQIPDNLTLFLGIIPGSIGETSKLAILLGAALLLITGVASWRIMLSTILGGITMAFIFNIINTNPYMTITPLQHILMGGFLFGTVFMATDPVTAAQTNTGKYIYGFLTGLFAIFIRVANPAYPEGMMLSILFMNALAPLIDHFVIERNIKKRKLRMKKI